MDTHKRTYSDYSNRRYATLDILIIKCVDDGHTDCGVDDDHTDCGVDDGHTDCGVDDSHTDCGVHMYLQ